MSREFLLHKALSEFLLFRRHFHPKVEYKAPKDVAHFNSARLIPKNTLFIDFHVKKCSAECHLRETSITLSFWPSSCINMHLSYKKKYHIFNSTRRDPSTGVRIDVNIAAPCVEIMFLILWYFFVKQSFKGYFQINLFN